MAVSGSVGRPLPAHCNCPPTFCLTSQFSQVMHANTLRRREVVLLSPWTQARLAWGDKPAIMSLTLELGNGTFALLSRGSQREHQVGQGLEGSAGKVKRTEGSLRGSNAEPHLTKGPTCIKDARCSTPDSAEAAGQSLVHTGCSTGLLPADACPGPCRAREPIGIAQDASCSALLACSWCLQLLTCTMPTSSGEMQAGKQP